MNLKNKVVVVTGASQGLGKNVAQKLAKLEAIVVLIARTEQLLQQVKQDIKKAGGKAEYFVCDIRDRKQIKSTVKAITSQFKEIDILINNAGVWTDDSLEKENPELKKGAF